MPTWGEALNLQSCASCGRLDEMYYFREKGERTTTPGNVFLLDLYDTRNWVCASCLRPDDMQTPVPPPCDVIRERKP